MKGGHFQTIGWYACRSTQGGMNMNTFENTVSMMEALPEADLIEIQNFTKKLYMLRAAESPFRSVTGEEILNDLQISREQVAQGRCKEMGQAIEGIRKKYGL